MPKAAPLDGVPSVSETLYGRLREGILTGVFPPGGVLRQEELARRLGASRVPLREAMTRLEVEGLVVLRPRRGYAVLSLDRSEIQEIFELRAAVEEHLASVAAQSRTDNDILAVSQALSLMERIATRSPNQIDKWLDANSEFHARLLSSAHRRHASRFATMLRDQVAPYIRIEINLTKDVRQAETEHRAMFEALQAGDAVRLRKLCRQHCEHTAARLIRGL
ncbi:GntR family transcriptional regulator [Bradyrhizobium sp. NP1]|uniref:GntR family transcriptional regulator n=1 Tax=Bradyrhizobium sp. NP1 TaxID=3049772 RepID=UPI0025A52758|nr:GntR family transcriptional regulator [Bradyrhizobium sp. NP1]WJR75746.1 GntR family transcriptional regulator [Bradyrhizobium sp. NP1]